MSVVLNDKNQVVVKNNQKNDKNIKDNAKLNLTTPLREDLNKYEMNESEK